MHVIRFVFHSYLHYLIYLFYAHKIWLHLLVNVNNLNPLFGFYFCNLFIPWFCKYGISYSAHWKLFDRFCLRKQGAMASNSTRMFAQWADGVVMLKWAFFKSITKFLARKQKKNVCIDRKENCLTFAFWWIWNGFVKPSWFGKQRYWNFLLSCFFFSQICLSIRRRKNFGDLM